MDPSLHWDFSLLVMVWATWWEGERLPVVDREVELLCLDVTPVEGWLSNGEPVGHCGLCCLGLLRLCPYCLSGTSQHLQPLSWQLSRRMELDNWKCDVQDSGLPPNSVRLYMTLTLRVKTLMSGLPFRPGFPHFILWDACGPPQGERWWVVCSLGVHSGALHVLFAAVRMLMSLVLGEQWCYLCSHQYLLERSQQYLFLGTFFPQGEKRWSHYIALTGLELAL